MTILKIIIITISARLNLLVNLSLSSPKKLEHMDRKNTEWVCAHGDLLSMKHDKSPLLSLNLCVDVAACFLTSSTSEEINKGIHSTVYLHSSCAEMTYSATCGVSHFIDDLNSGSSHLSLRALFAVSN